MNWLTGNEKSNYLAQGYQLSKSFDEEYEALNHIEYLSNLNNDPSYLVSIAGLYAHLDHYPQVVYKVTTSFS